ncbi:MAG: 50S ribosomal protein L18 [Bacteroidota bacterium]|nr:50S ribosomal protein L18 [Bacteroidota bacterium]
MALDKSFRRLKIKKRVRAKIAGTIEKPRLTVFRSNSGIYAQLIDDLKGATIVSASIDDVKSTKATKLEISKLVGKTLGEKAISKGISEVIFDRSGFLYHGRVKALADGAREAGLKF